MKAGPAKVTKSMANDWAHYNILVNAIGPGWVNTELTEALRKDKGGSPRYRAVSPWADGPIRRIWQGLQFSWPPMHPTTSPDRRYL
jgi:NAD(P)-dependent dehydrogenase (short-subunit alcohol dehydrogenase family)